MATRPATRPARQSARDIASEPAEETVEAPEATPPALPLGPSRIVWVFRVNGPTPMAMGKLYVIREEGSPHHLLQPRRRLMPGRYELMFARYGHRWPVTLARAEYPGHPDDMIAWGRVPL